MQKKVHSSLNHFVWGVEENCYWVMETETGKGGAHILPSRFSVSDQVFANVFFDALEPFDVLA